MGAIIRKEGLGRNPQVQTHEDALCLVFVELQFAEVAEKLGDDKMVDVVRKTLRKMSPKAIEATLALPLDPDTRDHRRARRRPAGDAEPLLTGFPAPQPTC